MSLKSAKPYVRLGRAVKLSGKVSGLTDPGGLALDLTEQYPAYNVSHTIRVKVKDDGSFARNVRPQVNARYRVAVAQGERAAGSSTSVTVVAIPKLTLEFDDSDGPLVVGVHVFAPASIDVDGARRAIRPQKRTTAYVYAINGKVGRRLLTLRVGAYCDDNSCFAEGIKHPKITAQLRNAKSFVACLRRPIYSGLGVRDPGCGGRTIRVG